MLRIILCLSLYQLVISSQLCLTPPAFPDIRQYLKTPESLALIQKLSDSNSEKNCSCAFEEGLQEANKYRDSADCDTPYFRCPVQTTVVTFQPTTMMYEDTTFVTEEFEFESEEPVEPVTPIPAKSPIVPTSRSSTSTSRSSSVGSSTSGSTTSTTPTPTKTLTKSTKTTKSSNNNDINKITKTSEKPTPVQIVQENGTDTTIVMGAVIACVLAVVIFVGVLLACRKNMPACPGPPAKVHKLPWLKQSTSQAPLMRNTSRKDTFDGSGNGEPVLISPGRVEEGQGDFIFLDKTEEEFHYNTLKAIDHNRALKHGFGETSTDKTLPRNTLKKQKKKNSKRNSEAKFVITGTPMRQDSNGASKTSDYESMNGNSIEYPDENDNHRRYSMTSKDSIDTDATFLSGDQSTNMGHVGPDDDLVSNDNIDLFDHDDGYDNMAFDQKDGHSYENMAFDKNGENTPPPHTSTPEEERKSIQLETVADVHTFMPPPPSDFRDSESEFVETPNDSEPELVETPNDSEPELVKMPNVAVVIPTVRNSNHNSLESLTDVGPYVAPTADTNSSDNTNSGMNAIQYMTYDRPKKLDPTRFSFLEEANGPYNTLSKPPIFQNGDLQNKNGPFIPVSKTNGVANGGFLHNHIDEDNQSTKYGDTRL